VEEKSIVYGFKCHMHNNVTYPILMCMFGYGNDQQLHPCVTHDTWHSGALTKWERTIPLEFDVHVLQLFPN